MRYRICLLAALLAGPASALGQDGAAPEAAPTGEAETEVKWKGEAELGFVSTSGNTDTKTLNARLTVENEWVDWRNRLRATYLKSEGKNGTTAEQLAAAFKSDYKLSDANYLFLNLQYLDDRFGGFDYRFSETFGYGHRFRFGASSQLDTEAGAGGRHTKYMDGRRDDEGVLRLALNYIWRFSETGEFRETAYTEIGDINTHSEAETAVKFKINGNLALKVSHRLMHDTQVPPDTRSTDTVTGVTLVYDFL